MTRIDFFLLLYSSVNKKKKKKKKMLEAISGCVGLCVCVVVCTQLGGFSPSCPDGQKKKKKKCSQKPVQ